MANENLDLISRSALIAEYDRVHIGPPGGARKLMEDAPTVDAAPVVHGRWIFEQAYEDGTADYKCSICDFDDAFPIGNFTYRNYCNNCGSQMDGGNEDG